MIRVLHNVLRGAGLVPDCGILAASDHGLSTRERPPRPQTTYTASDGGGGRTGALAGRSWVVPLGASLKASLC